MCGTSWRPFPPALAISRYPAPPPPSGAKPRSAQSFATTRAKSAISVSLASAPKWSKVTYLPLGITSTCTGACARMSWKASVCSVSATVLFGISPRRMRANTF